MSEPVSPFIVPQKESDAPVYESFASGSASGTASASASGIASASASASTPLPVSASEAPDSISSSDLDVAQLQAVLEAVRATDTRPVGASIVDTILGFFAGIVSLLKYIFKSLSDGIGINEFQFGYIILGLGALFMTLPLWGEPRLRQGPLPRNSRIPTSYTPIINVPSQPQVQ